MTKSKYLIIGNSTAAIAAVEAIRSNDQAGTITLVSDEPYHTYSRPLISYLLEGKTTEEKMIYRDLSFYKSNSIRTLFGIKAEKLDVAKKTVTLADGSQEKYDKLLLATGSIPFIPPTPGCPEVNSGHGVYTFIKKADALALLENVHKDTAVVVVGGGLTGVKATEGLIHLSDDITMVELAGRILPVALDSQASDIFKQRLQSAGVKVNCDTSVAEVLTSDSGNVTAVRLSDGRTIKCDVLVLSIGVRPNLSLIKDTSIAVKRGIVIDQSCQTSVPDIYSAGDCVESFDLTDKVNRILAILPNAYYQGKVAGNAMSEGKKKHSVPVSDDDKYSGTYPINATSFIGLPLITAGKTNPPEDFIARPGVEVIINRQDENYRKLVIENNKLIGFILIGFEYTKRAGILTSLLRSERDLSTVADIRTQAPELMIFPQKERTELLFTKG